MAGAKRLYVSRCQAAAIFCLFAIVVFGVGLMAGLIRPSESEPTHACLQGATYSDERQEPWLYVRLPTDIIPDHYDLTLYPDFYDTHDRFYGNATLILNITAVTNHILLHVKDLDITNTVLREASTKETVGIRKTFSYMENEYFVIEAIHPLQAEMQYEVCVEFQGSLTNGIVGLYKSVYRDSRTNQTKYMATSKFQPTDARKAFPCLDEPAFKATFTVTLIHRSNYFALSNMPPKHVTTSRANGLVETHFEKSVAMSTYLACFIVCEDFAYKENFTANGTPIRVYASPDKIDQADYALKVGVDVLQLFEGFFGLRYPLPKLDMIAIPDFVSGAMEHWGLVTFRETNLLYQPLEASEASKQRVAIVVAHELAHMWFGNLVTMEWWDALWLNEGFASYIEYMGVANTHPDWDMGAQFVNYDLQSVMEDDAQVNSHPIIVSVDHPDQITELFDSISYNKGACVLRMLEFFMGSDQFQIGLQDYVREYMYKTTVTDDLWRALQRVPGAPRVKAIMDTWTRQMGYPVVSVTVQGKQIKLTQERFIMDQNADKSKPPSPYGYQWYIPITYQTSSGESSGIQWMENSELLLDVQVNPATDWIKLNINETGYYRVNYPVDIWRNMAAALRDNYQAFSPSDRSGLLDNAFSLADAGLLSYERVLDMLWYMEREQHLVPWKTANSKLRYIDEMLYYGPFYGDWQRFVRHISVPHQRALGYDNSGDHLERQLRNTMIYLACGHGCKYCLSNMTTLFARWMAGDHIQPNIRGAVYNYGMKAGGEAEWDHMYTQYTTMVVPQERRNLLYGLTRTIKPWLISKLLQFGMDETKVRSQDFFIMISYLSKNKAVRPRVWNWAQEHWPELIQKFSLNSRYLGRMVPGIVRSFNTQFQLDQVTAFFNKYPDAGAGTWARQQILEQIKTNIDWKARNEYVIGTWLRENTQS